MTDLTPREIVSDLDRFIIGQKDAKRAVAVALSLLRLRAAEAPVIDLHFERCALAPVSLLILAQAGHTGDGHPVALLQVLRGSLAPLAPDGTAPPGGELVVSPA